MLIFKISSTRVGLSSDGNDPKEREGLLLQKRREIDTWRRFLEGKKRDRIQSTMEGLSALLRFTFMNLK